MTQALAPGFWLLGEAPLGKDAKREELCLT